jgi:hypothetical protein
MRADQGEAAQVLKALSARAIAGWLLQRLFLIFAAGSVLSLP